MIDVIVNGKALQAKAGLSYDDIVALAELPRGPTYSITYRGRVPGSASGILKPGEHIIAMEGTVFNVFHTGNA